MLPLGAGALAGTPFPIDRESVARELGFARVSENSLDSVADRDFVLELAATLSILMVHQSFEVGKLGYGSAIAIAMMLIVGLLALFYLRQLKEPK